jgi:hypothetical protein
MRYPQGTKFMLRCSLASHCRDRHLSPCGGWSLAVAQARRSSSDGMFDGPERYRRCRHSCIKCASGKVSVQVRDFLPGEAATNNLRRPELAANASSDQMLWRTNAGALIGSFNGRSFQSGAEIWIAGEASPLHNQQPPTSHPQRHPSRASLGRRLSLLRTRMVMATRPPSSSAPIPLSRSTGPEDAQNTRP